MKGPVAIVALGAGLLASAPAFAWEVLDDTQKDGRCAFAQVFDTPGQTTFVVSQNQKEFDDADSVQVIVYNRNWSLQKGENLSDTISLVSNAVKIDVEGPSAVDNGLGLTISYDHLQKFAAGNPQLVIIRKGEQAIARLNFAGFPAAWARFEACRRDKVATRSERRRSLDEVPLNPFAESD